MNTDVTDPEITNFDWFDMSSIEATTGEPLTDKQKWKIITSLEAIALLPHLLTKEEQILDLKRFLWAFGLVEGDFTIEGVLKVNNPL